MQDNKLLKTMKKGIKGGYNMMGDVVLTEKDGFIFFQAREDDMIKSSGFRLAPTEIEDALIRHPAVRDDSVVGIPDEILGQKVVAMVELESGYAVHGHGQRRSSCPYGCLLSTNCPGEVVFLGTIPHAHGQSYQEGAAAPVPGIHQEVPVDLNLAFGASGRGSGARRLFFCGSAFMHIFKAVSGEIGWAALALP